MRITSLLRISKRSIFFAAPNMLMVFGVLTMAAVAPIQHQTVVEMGDMGAFIEDHAMTLKQAPEGATLEDLGAFIESLPEGSEPVIVVPIPNAPMREAKLSDGKFETLSASWKRGVHQVVREKRCRKIAQAFTVSAMLEPVLQAAHAIVESNCDAKVVGAAGEIGIFQVMPKTCKEIGITGDYRDPIINARCTEKYRQVLCATSKKACTAKLMFLAHNRGIAGALRTKQAESTEYIRKVDCAVRVLRNQRCV